VLLRLSVRLTLCCVTFTFVLCIVSNKWLIDWLNCIPTRDKKCCLKINFMSWSPSGANTFPSHTPHNPSHAVLVPMIDAYGWQISQHSRSWGAEDYLRVDCHVPLKGSTGILSWRACLCDSWVSWCRLIRILRPPRVGGNAAVV